MEIKRDRIQAEINRGWIRPVKFNPFLFG